ncbi:MAG: acyltransferase family protein [Candidatus Thalassarchaeaceae archaeon]
MEVKKIRRYDIDWLRVILFGLLIPFHVAIGVYWSTYGTDINPNIQEINETDELIFIEESNDYTAESISFTSMILHWMHQWRLAALFMISGMGTAFAFKSRTWKFFLKERCQRLLIPMFFGAWTMGFIGSVILGNESSDPVSLTKSFISGIFWRSLVFWIPVFGKLIALGHLWFLWNLFQYSLFMTPIFHYVSKYPDGELVRILRSFFTIPLNLGILFILPFTLTITEILFKPWFPGYIGVGYEWFWFFIFFAFGYICIIAKEQYYDFIETKRVLITAITLLLTIAFIWIRIQQHESGIPYIDGGWLENNIFHNGMTIFACFIHSFHAWFWCLTIFSWGSKFLNKPSKNLAYLNQGVYPFYIVHMPLTFAGLRISSDLGIKNYPAVLLSTIIVIITCWLFFELVRRTKVSRFLFGIKERKLED